jgi:hypothetical protein
MKPDFIIAEKHTAAGSVFIVLPTHITALNWMFAHVEASERKKMSAHLVESRFAQFKSDAVLASMTLTHSFSAGLAPEKVQ